MVGGAWLCDGKVESVSGVGLALRLTSDTIECGQKGALVTVPASALYSVRNEKMLTKGRVALKIAAALGAIAAVAAIPLTSSDPESLLIIANPVIPGLAGLAGWSVVPAGKRHVLLITCPDRFHCFSDPEFLQTVRRDQADCDAAREFGRGQNIGCDDIASRDPPRQPCSAGSRSTTQSAEKPRADRSVPAQRRTDTERDAIAMRTEFRGR
jgi:hypothetical protein